MKLQERDLKILKYIQESRTMNIEQLKKRFWPSQTVRAARMKMERLAKRGLVQHVKKEFLRISSYYYLTKSGYDALGHAGLNQEVIDPFLAEPSDIVRSDFQHHVRVTDMRIALETDGEVRISNWIPETAIRADKKAFNIKESGPENKGAKSTYRIPDAIFTLEDAEVKISILLEYEHSKYQRWKFRSYMEFWEGNWNKYQKLMVTADADRSDQLRQWCLEDLKEIHKIDLNRKQCRIEDLAEAYMFTDYHTLMAKGIIKAGLKSPISKIEFSPITSKS